jgi:hypothetical protein
MQDGLHSEGEHACLAGSTVLTTLGDHNAATLSTVSFSDGCSLV